MLRALFLREFRRSWLIHAGLFAAIFGMVTVLEYAFTQWMESALGSERQRSFLLVLGIIFSALISGERCFSTVFKEGRYHFLLTMPTPRGSIYFAYTGGRLLGALAALPVIPLARPGLLLWGSFSSYLVLVLDFYLVYFFTGAALALAVRKEVLVYLLGFPLAICLSFLLSSSARWGFDKSIDVWVEIPKVVYRLSLGSLVLALVEAAWARRAFCRGELFLQRRNARALAEGGLTFAAFAALTIFASSNSSLAALDDEWQPATPAGIYPYHVHPVSPDGRFRFIFQQLRLQKSFKRLAVVDLKSGLLSSWFERSGLHQISWSPSGNVLQVMATNDTPLDCLGPPCDGSTTWYRLTPDLQVLSAQRLKELPRNFFPGTTLETVEAHRPGSPPALLFAPRTASQEGFDQVVFEFAGNSVPGYRVGYVNPSAVRCRSGETVEVAGAALLQVRLVPATTHNEAGKTTVPSPEIRPGLAVIQEMDMICNFEGNVTWLLGLAARNRFRVHELAEPARLVVEIEHGR